MACSRQRVCGFGVVRVSGAVNTDTTILFEIITRMNYYFSELLRGLQLQLSGVFRINLHYSYSFHVLTEC